MGPHLTWLLFGTRRQVREPKIQQRGTTFALRKPSPRSTLRQSFSPGTLAIDPILNLTDNTTLLVPQRWGKKRAR